MKVTRIEIRNLLGIESLDVEPGALTVITGGNGVGKTSFLTAVRAIATEGHDPSLLRTGAEKGSVRIILEDGSILEKTVTPKNSSFSGIHPKVGKVSRARAWVDSLVDELGVDPLAIINCPASKRAEYLADLLSFEVTDEQLQSAVRGPIRNLAATKRLPGLDRIKAVREALYDERTGHNKTRKDKLATVEQLRGTIPPARLVAVDPSALRARKEAAERERDAAVRDAEAEAQAVTAQAERDFQALKNQLATAKTNAVKSLHTNEAADLLAIQQDADAKIQAIRVEAEARSAAVRSARSEGERTILANLSAQHETGQAFAAERTRAAGEKARAAIRAANDAAAPVLEALAAELAAAEAAEREEIRSARTREIIAQAETDAETAGAEAETLTAGIRGLDALRAALLAQVPVPGLELRDGQVYVDGHPFDRVNTARQMEIALEVALLRAKDVPLLVADHGEALDTPAWAALETKAAGLGMTLIVARRTDGPLTVTTHTAPLAGEKAA